jgi:hypothetical protein
MEKNDGKNDNFFTPRAGIIRIFLINWIFNEIAFLYQLN